MTPQEEINELKARIAKLEAGLQKRFVPEMRQVYWCNDSGCITFKSTWKGDPIDRYRLAMGNVFRTKENAALWAEIQGRAIELRGDWLPDWDDIEQDEYYLVWDYQDGQPRHSSSTFIQFQGAFYMPEHAANTLIKEYGGRLKIWICGES